MNTPEILKHLRPIGGTTFQPVQPDEIAEIERLLAKKLPADYVAFITKYGHCGVDGDAIIGDLLVFFFYGGGSKIGSLLNAVKCYDGFAENGWLVIARDLLGNLFALYPDTGEIWFSAFTPQGPVNLELATSFTDFLSKIEVKPIE